MAGKRRLAICSHIGQTEAQSVRQIGSRPTRNSREPQVSVHEGKADEERQTTEVTRLSSLGKILRLLTRLSVNGFKNLIDVDLYFGHFTCIAGANGVGKSNLFDAILIVPVRMQEPWLLFDEQAIRRAAGNPGGKTALPLPRLTQLESLPDPKETLYGLLVAASEHQGRRRGRFNPSRAARNCRLAGASSRHRRRAGWLITVLDPDGGPLQ